LKTVEEVKGDLRKELYERRELRRRVKSVIIEMVRGKCPFCGEFKTLIHLRGEVTACEDCLEISASILMAARKPISREKMILTLKLQKILKEAENE